jgi:hypothetical protein
MVPALSLSVVVCIWDVIVLESLMEHEAIAEGGVGPHMALTSCGYGFGAG